MSDLRSRIYEGFVTHARTSPVKHGFSFPIYTFVLDLDELERLGSWFWNYKAKTE